MKKFNLFALAIAALSLTACSSDDPVVNNPQGPNVAGEKAYVSLAINLPTEPTARANDNFDDGLASEYAVRNATLLLFTGATEADAQFASAYDLPVDGFSMVGTTTDQITSEAILVQEITRPTTNAGDNIYALVVLNHNGLLSLSGNTASCNGSPVADFASFTTSAASFANGADALTGAGFYMANAPLSNAVSAATVTADNISTLAVVDPNKIYSTRNEASLNPAATIYVERGMAKVTLQAQDGTNSDGSKVAAYALKGWTLDITNTKSYLVRNVACTPAWWGYKNTASSSYRFVGNTAIDGQYYRTYWGIDPNYGEYVPADFAKLAGTVTDLSTAYGSENPLYCLENTFDVPNMNENQTTRVILKAQLTLDGETAPRDFYVLNGNTSQILTEDGVKAAIQERLMNAWVIDNWATYASAGTIDGADLTVTLDNAEGGNIDVTSVTLADETGITWKGGQSLDAFNAALAAQVQALAMDIAYYQNGEAYYAIKIRHFDETEAPWSVTGAVSYPGDDAADNWLGRWGVLRNNWYDITVTGIKNIGAPEVPEATASPDDPLNSYIAVEIKVLSWALRTQEAEL